MQGRKIALFAVNNATGSCCNSDCISFQIVRILAKTYRGSATVLDLIFLPSMNPLEGTRKLCLLLLMCWRKAGLRHTSALIWGLCGYGG